ncbi:MAG: tetraacyldisaccharide 4'-kinase [Planctomycetota bacterium]|nr:tetraacyldisaccharide 4'-kinase [Planctomycetota bacterium]
MIVLVRGLGRVDLSRLHQFRSWPEFLLRFLELLWRAGVRIVSWRRGIRESSGNWPLRLPVPVISVGNIAVGGTGKTPVTAALARYWLARGGKPGIVSRGYRGEGTGNDEYLMMKKRLPEVPHFQNRCRYEAGKELLEHHPETDLILLDDGFQHRRLYRDLDLVLLDGADPLGGGHCVPLGLLREPWKNLSRADHLILTRVERCDERRRAQSLAFLQQWFPGIRRWLAETEVLEMRSLSGGQVPRPPDSIYACSAIGDPDSFRSTLESQGWNVVGATSFRDHHRYSRPDLVDVDRQARALGANFIACTAKDAVKIEALESPGGTALLPILVQEIDTTLDVEHLLETFCSGSSPGTRELPAPS